MSIVLKHPFINKLPDVDEFFLTKTEIGCINSIESFCHRVIDLSEKHKDKIDPDMFKGDALEMLVEYMLATDGSDNRIGIHDAKIISETGHEDLGVDMAGIGDNSFPATVQVKFRTGDWVLTANKDHLSNFLTSSWMTFGVRMEDDKNMLIITTGLKVDENTKEKMLFGKVRVLNRDVLRKMFDNRPEWWKKFYEAVRDSGTPAGENPPIIPLRQHQQEAVDITFKTPDTKGMLILPTGTGKTMIEADIMCRFLIETKTKSRKELGIDSDNSFKDFPPIVKLHSSRILLCFQLFDEVLNRMNSYGIRAKWVNFNSGTKDDADFAQQMKAANFKYRTILSTTSPKEVQEEYEICKKEGLPLIIISTYDSGEKFDQNDKGLKPDITIHDEAHNLVSQENYRCATLTPWHNYFFTATTKTCGYLGGIGMNNPQIFDNLLYSKSARELIEAGEIVPPHLHVISSKNGNSLDEDYKKMILSVFEAFEHHAEKISKDSYNSTELGAKVLVVCRGQLDLEMMLHTDEFLKYKADHPEIYFAGLCSTYGIYDNGIWEKAPVTNMKKYALLKKIKSLKNGDKAIFFHVDMIGEGIDVPGITGVMPFRNCNLVKMLQNIGRSMRLHKIDRANLYNNPPLISVADKTKWIKPNCWVIIPSYMVDTQGIENRITEIVTLLRNETGYIPDQIDLVEDGNGPDAEQIIDITNPQTKNPPNHNSNIDDFEHEFEDETPIGKLLVQERIVDYKAKFMQHVESQGFKRILKPIKESSKVDISGAEKVTEINRGNIDEHLCLEAMELAPEKHTKEGEVLYRKRERGQGRPRYHVRVGDKFAPVKIRMERKKDTSGV